MREADENGVLTELGKKTLCVLDSVSRMAKSRYGELTPLGARQHKGIAERMYKNFPEVFKGEARWMHAPRWLSAAFFLWRQNV